MKSRDQKYDAIVTGARCAGSPTAMLLARKGYKVLLVDKASFPSDTMSTLIIWPRGISYLKRWGLLERLKATGAPPITRKQRFDPGPFTLTGSAAAFDDAPSGYAPRRVLLDKILVDAAEASGVEVRQGYSLGKLIWEGDTVTGMTIKSKDGKEFTEHSSIVIGADGLHSKVAALVDAQEYNSSPTLSVSYYTFYSDLPCEGVEFYVRPNCGFGMIPTNDNLTLIIAGRPIADFREYRSNIEKSFLGVIAQAPQAAERVAAARRADRYAGTANMPGYFKKPYGKGWALAGDAAYHKDSITAQGISDAFFEAEMLAEAIDEGFSGREDLQTALANYEKRRNESLMPMYDFTCQLAKLEPPPLEMVQVLSALQGNQEDTDRFFGMIAGSVPIPEFFAPENVQRIMSMKQN